MQREDSNRYKDLERTLGEFCLNNNTSMQDLEEIKRHKNNSALGERNLQNLHYDRFINNSKGYLRSEDILVDLESELVLKDENILLIHPHEFLILKFLMSNPKEIIEDYEIMRILETYGHIVTIRSMVVYMSRISKAIGETSDEDKYLKRKSKKGYYWTRRVEIVSSASS